jgi:hypothetical protein
MKSLLDQLPGIVAEGKREAERVMERAESNYRLGLQTRELVIPSKGIVSLRSSRRRRCSNGSRLPVTRPVGRTSPAATRRKRRSGVGECLKRIAFLGDALHSLQES